MPLPTVAPEAVDHLLLDLDGHRSIGKGFIFSDYRLRIDERQHRIQDS